MKKVVHALITFVSVIAFTIRVAATANMVPPSNGTRNSVTFNGRTYSATPGVAAPVPDFDVPVLQANGWTISSLATTPETAFGAIRRLARRPTSQAPFIDSQLVGARPWASGAAVTSGVTVMSSSGKAYLAQTTGTTGATAPTGYASVSDGAVTWQYIGAQTAPQLTSMDTTTHNAALTNIVTMASQAMLPGGQGQVRWRGGVPTQKAGAAGYFAAASVTVAPAAGNITGTQNQVAADIEFVCECVSAEIALTSGTNGLFVMVDGRYLDYQPTLTAGTPHYFTIDFSNVVSSTDMTTATGRSRHNIRFIFRSFTAISQIATEPASTISYPQYDDEWGVAVIADSQGTTSISGTVTSQAQAWPYLLSKIMHLPDLASISIGGTGMVNAGGSTPFGGHALADLAAYNAYRPIKFIIVQSSTNDIGQPIASITAAASALISSIRAAYPTIPIFVTGVIQGGNVLPANAQAVENAVFAGVAGISGVYTVPVSTASPPWFSGTGHEGAPNGTGNNDFDSLPDGIHLSLPGISRMATRVAAAILAIAGTNP